MKRYDPLRAPDPADWLSLEESERIHMVEEYHRRARIRLPNALLHATFHAVVETQLAEGEAIPVQETLDRLLVEGLDRHEAVHAIGNVLAEHMYDLLRNKTAAEDPNPAYLRALGELAAAGWRKTGRPGDGGNGAAAWRGRYTP